MIAMRDRRGEPGNAVAAEQRHERAAVLFRTELC
jgi:hypothetical protein